MVLFFERNHSFIYFSVNILKSMKHCHLCDFKGLLRRSITFYDRLERLYVFVIEM